MSTFFFVDSIKLCIVVVHTIYHSLNLIIDLLYG